MSGYSTGDRVQADRDINGFGVSAGQTGEVVGTGLFGEYSEVRWSDGTVSEVSNSDLKRRS